MLRLVHLHRKDFWGEFSCEHYCKAPVKLCILEMSFLNRVIHCVKQYFYFVLACACDLRNTWVLLEVFVVVVLLVAISVLFISVKLAGKTMLGCAGRVESPSGAEPQ